MKLGIQKKSIPAFSRRILNVNTRVARIDSVYRSSRFAETIDLSHMRFSKYHALGNDYIVIDPRDHPASLGTAQIVRICHRNFGIGSDGVLWGPLPARDGAPFALRIFNPDGSEAQKSGNGLRIFCRYLFDRGLVKHESFKVHTLGGIVAAQVHGVGESVTVEMGRVTFRSDEIPVNVSGAAREVIRETLNVADRSLVVSCASIGNPHCVVELSADESVAKTLGPQIETHAMFPQRTNVQFLRIIDRANIEIQIWERGAGYTLASGSSSSAAAAVAHRLGLVERSLTVHMPGGKIRIEIGEHFAITMTGAVTRIAEGEMFDEALVY
jgi:diaminopimelate epimerase